MTKKICMEGYGSRAQKDQRLRKRGEGSHRPSEALIHLQVSAHTGWLVSCVSQTRKLHMPGRSGDSGNSAHCVLYFRYVESGCFM